MRTNRSSLRARDGTVRLALEQLTPCRLSTGGVIWTLSGQLHAHFAYQLSPPSHKFQLPVQGHIYEAAL